MAFGFTGFNSFNMYMPYSYGGYYGGYNPFCCGYYVNPFSVFNMAMQLMSSAFPSVFNTNNNVTSGYNLNYNFTMPFVNQNYYGGYSYNSLYDGMYPYKDYSKDLINSFGTVAIPSNTGSTKKDSNVFIKSPVSNTGNISFSKTKKTSFSSVGVYKYAPSSITLSGSHLNKEFLDKVKQVAKNLNCDYEDLLAVMNSESSLNPAKWNSSKSAVGLIQFTNSALAEINRVYGIQLTKEDVAKMNAIDQLDLAEKYLKITTRKFGGRKLSAADLYASLYLPARAKNDILTRRGENYYDCNRGLDMDGDGVITKSDLERRLAQKRVNLNTFV